MLGQALAGLRTGRYPCQAAYLFSFIFPMSLGVFFLVLPIQYFLYKLNLYFIIHSLSEIIIFILTGFTCVLAKVLNYIQNSLYFFVFVFL